MDNKPFMFNPLAAQAMLLQAMIDASREAHDVSVAAVKRAGERKSSPIEWVTFEMPVVNPGSFIDEQVMRDTFHRLADRNLRGWEVAAELLKAMPNWMTATTKVPGTVLTDWFDQMRRAGQTMMTSTDTWTNMDLARPILEKAMANVSRAKAVAEQAETKTAENPVAKPKPVAPAKKPAAKPETIARAPKAKPIAKAAPKPTTPAAKVAPKTTAAKPKTKRETPSKPTTPKLDGPVRLDGPRGKADDLTAIKGIGEKLASLLNSLGIYHYDQVAAWTKKDGEWIDAKLAFKGRVAREAWIKQAKALAKKNA